MKNAFRKITQELRDLFEEEAEPGEVVYNPVHIAETLVGCLVAFGVLYWLLWSLLVCEGGIFTKIGPFFQILFTSKTLKDFGYEGYPYQLGVFEGWIVNLSALLLTLLLIWTLRRLYKHRGRC